MILHCLRSSTHYLVSSVPGTPVIPEVHLRRYEMEGEQGVRAEGATTAALEVELVRRRSG